MGLFKKRINPYKYYSMKEVMEILSQPEFQNYTSIERGKGRYSIITVKESKELETRIQERKRMKSAFYETYE